MTMSKKTILYPLLGITLAAMAAPAMAAHFTFKVPVELHKLRNNVTNTLVQCVVYDENGGVIGQNGQSITINRQVGEFVTTLTIGVDADLGKSAFDARTYKCFLGLMQAIGANPPKQMPGPNNPNLDFQPAAGTPFINEVTGNLPGSLQRQAPKQRLVPRTLWR
jgi:hypothetical protein